MKMLSPKLVLGLCLSVVSLAASANTETDFRYKCEFSSAVQNGRNLKCKVFGLYCGPGNTLECSQQTDSGSDPMAVFCSNDFKLIEDDAATSEEYDNLFFNAIQGGKAAALTIFDVSATKNFEREAELLFSPKLGKAFRLEGECEIELGSVP